MGRKYLVVIAEYADHPKIGIPCHDPDPLSGRIYHTSPPNFHDTELEVQVWDPSLDPIYTGVCFTLPSSSVTHKVYLLPQIGCDTCESGKTYSGVTSPETGRVWLDRNLGACRVAQTIDDYYSFGSLFQWGRFSDGHECITWYSNSGATPEDGICAKTSSGNTVGQEYFIVDNIDWRNPKNDNLWQGLNGTNNPCVYPCPENYRLPTQQEWLDEISGFVTQDAQGAFDSFLKLPLSGSRNYAYPGYIQFETGKYWTSTVSGNSVMIYDNCNMIESYRSYGFPVRPILDLLCPEIFIDIDNNPVCSGSSVKFYSAVFNTSTAIYQWYVNYVTDPSWTNSTFTYIPSDGDYVYCMLTGDTCEPVKSNDIIVSVTEPCSLNINIFKLGGESIICEGRRVEFSGTTQCGGTSPTYQWIRSGNTSTQWEIMNGQNSLYMWYVPEVGHEKVACYMTSNEVCVSPSAKTSNIIEFDVNPIIQTTVTITAEPSGATCSGTTVTYTAIGTSGGTSPTYQWYVSGSTGIISDPEWNRSAFTWTPSNGEKIGVVFTGSLPCSKSSYAIYQAVVLPLVYPSIDITSSPLYYLDGDDNRWVNINQGQTVYFQAIDVTGICGREEYQWYLNSGQTTWEVGTNSPFYTLTNGDRDEEVWCKVWSDCLCAQNPAESPHIAIETQETTGKTITISCGSAVCNYICSGDTICFTATTYGFSGTPSYQWSYNSGTSWQNVGTNSAYYCTSGLDLHDGDKIRCQATEGGTYTSNEIIIHLKPSYIPSVSIDVYPRGYDGEYTYCDVDMPLYFYITSINPSGCTNAANYLWEIYYEETETWHTLTTVFVYFLVINVQDVHHLDRIRLTYTSCKECSEPETAQDTITLYITPTTDPSVTISGTTDCITINEPITFTATPTNGGTSPYPIYSWHTLPPTEVSNNNPWTTSFTTEESYQIWCYMTTNALCSSTGYTSGSTLTLRSNTLQLNPCSGATIIECLEELTVEVYYYHNRYYNGQSNYNPYVWPPPPEGNGSGCYGNHTCNSAKYKIYANDIAIGIANLNNYGQDDLGTVVQTGFGDVTTYQDEDIPYTNNVFDRYWKQVITSDQAVSIANGFDGIRITFECVSTILWQGTDNYCHPFTGSGNFAGCMRISRKIGETITQIRNVCMKTYRDDLIDPCTGDLIPEVDFTGVPHEHSPIWPFNEICHCEVSHLFIPSCTFTFYDTTINPGTSATYLWNFGDGDSSTLQNPSHTYTDFGYYTVSLMVTNSEGSWAETKTDYVWIEEVFF